MLLDRNQPHLGLLTYTVTDIDSGIIARFNTLPLWNSSNFFRLDLENLLVGNYRLTLNFPENSITTDIKVNSSSTKVSPIYSYAERVNGTFANMQMNQYVTIKLFARNIHNQTIEKNVDSALIMSQCRVYLTNSVG